jgi:phage repressor protein C with HTH and peptisase S24 domain
MNINKSQILKTIKDHYNFNSDAEFARFLDIKPQVLSNWYARNTFDYEILYTKCVDLNLDWLFTGEGDMLKKMSSESFDYKRLENDDVETNMTEIPLYDINAAAGLRLLFDNGRQNMIDTIKIPYLTKSDGAIFITGDSMYPLMKSGDIVIYKQIHNLDYLHYGDMYIVSYHIDGDDYVVIKYVQKSEKADHVKLVSYNQHYDPVDIPLLSINAIAIVQANIRYNTM